MKCEDCIAAIEEYLDNELGNSQAERVRSHLSACAECAGVYEALEQEHLIYARYQRDIKISPAMWTSIESKIKPEPAREVSPGRSLRELLAGLFATPRLSFAYTVALVLIAVGATVLVMSYLQKGASNNPTEFAGNKGVQTQPPPARVEQPAAPQTPGPQDGANNNIEPGSKVATAPRPKPRVVKQPPSPEQLVREAEEKYLSAIAILTRDVNRNRSKLDPLVLAKFENALASINRTIEETRAAARGNPDDPIALQYMLSAYSKKVEILREMTRN